MRFAVINNRKIAQRARRDAEAENRPPRQGPPQIPHGTVIGNVVIKLHGQTVEAELLQAGDRCRSYGVRIDGKMLPKIMGLYRAAAEVSSCIARVPGKRSDFWQD
jgi:hypothetical protein